MAIVTKIIHETTDGKQFIVREDAEQYEKDLLTKEKVNDLCWQDHEFSVDVLFEFFHVLPK